MEVDIYRFGGRGITINIYSIKNTNSWGNTNNKVVLKQEARS